MDSSGHQIRTLTFNAKYADLFSSLIDNYRTQVAGWYALAAVAAGGLAGVVCAAAGTGPAGVACGLIVGGAVAGAGIRTDQDFSRISTALEKAKVIADDGAIAVSFDWLHNTVVITGVSTDGKGKSFEVNGMDIFAMQGVEQAAIDLGAAIEELEH